jgi:hypothetical protein
MSIKIIEDVINDVLKEDIQKNALELISHLRVGQESVKFSIDQHDEKDTSGWNVKNLGFIIINGSNEFPGPWTMWIGVDNIGESLKIPVEEHIKEFAWSHVSPCGNCGGKCSPGTNTKIFGKDFVNVCQNNLIFINPDAKTVDYMRRIIDIRKNEIIKKN